MSSRSRQTSNDGVNATGTGGDRRQQRISNFSVFTVRKSVDELTARASRDQAEDLAVFLFKALVGHEFESGLTGSNQMGVVYVDDGLELYNTAIYMHSFNFQQVADINTDDGVDPNALQAKPDPSIGSSPVAGEQKAETETRRSP